MIGALEPHSEEGTVSGSAPLKRSRHAPSKLVSQALGDSCAVLGVACPLSATDACRNLTQSIKTVVARLAKAKKVGIIDESVLDYEALAMSNEEWDTLCELNDTFSEHYTLRKRMLRKRLEVTIDAMLEAETAKLNMAEIMAGLRKRQSEIRDECQIPVWAAFAMQRDILRVDPITTLTSEVDSPVRRHEIGKVPDRGGRATEVRQVEIDAIPFSSFGGKRRGRGRGRGRGGGRGRGRGGRGRGRGYGGGGGGRGGGRRGGGRGRRY